MIQCGAELGGTSSNSTPVGEHLNRQVILTSRALSVVGVFVRDGFGSSGQIAVPKKNISLNKDHNKNVLGLAHAKWSEQNSWYLLSSVAGLSSHCAFELPTCNPGRPRRHGKADGCATPKSPPHLVLQTNRIFFSSFLPTPQPQCSSHPRGLTMAADIGQISQLLNATLDPSQHHKGMARIASLSFVLLPRSSALINKRFCSRECSQAGGRQASVFPYAAEHRQFRHFTSKHPLGSVVGL